MKVIVDNSAGGDDQLAREVAASLRDEGFAVEFREPAETAMFDTGVHLVSAGMVLRFPSPPTPCELAVIRRVVRAALLRRPSLRRRSRSVPIYLAETSRALGWIDVVE